jgi:hypothetical protein
MRLLVVDVEGTLFKTSIKLPGTSIDSTIWQSIAQALGSQAVKEEVATHRKWELGEYKNYLGSSPSRVGKNSMKKGVSTRVIRLFQWSRNLA